MMKFEEWLEKQPDFSVPVVRWGEVHSEIAERYAKDCIARAIDNVLGEALNSGDGSYRP